MSTAIRIAEESTTRAVVMNRVDYCQNDLLAAMPADEIAYMQPHFRQDEYPSGRTILNPEDSTGSIYFPLAGTVVSITAVLKDGRNFEVCMAGREGLVGLWELLGAKTSRYRAVVQSAGTIVRIQADVLRLGFARSGALQDRLLRYTRYVLTQTSQAAACNRAHRLEQRLARWLLMTRDRAGSNEFLATHESLSNMLGTPRSEVTIAAGILRSKKIICYHRGKITILDPRELESTACECYKILKEELLNGS